MSIPAVTTLGVVGAGFMGSGIAEAAARAGIDVTVHEPAEAALQRSRDQIEQSVARAVDGGKLAAEAAGELLARIAWSSDLDALGAADVVVEAIVEDLGVKQDVFARVDAATPHARVQAS